MAEHSDEGLCSRSDITEADDWCKQVMATCVNITYIYILIYVLYILIHICIAIYICTYTILYIIYIYHNLYNYNSIYIYTSPCTIFISRYYPFGWCKKLGDFSDGWRDCARDKWWWNDKKFGWTAIHTGWWLVVSNIFYFSIIYGNNTPIWLSYFSEG